MHKKLTSKELVDIDALVYRNGLPPYAQELFRRLIPILKRLDPNQLSERSFIAVEEQRKESILVLKVDPSDENIPFLVLRAYPDHCYLGLADSEYLEAHRIPSDWQELVNQVISETEKYLSGVTIVERYNHKNKLIGKTYFYGIDSENDKSLAIGNSSFLFFPRKVASIVKRTHRFFKEEPSI